jgi:hypothetical protein
MHFPTISDLLDLRALNEDAAEGLGMAAKDHPQLSRAEITRMASKFDRAREKLEEIQHIFKPVEDVKGPAHKLHHIGIKANLDPSAFEGVQAAIDSLAAAIDECQQSWGGDIQQDVAGADDTEDPADDTEDLAGDLADDDADLEEPPEVEVSPEDELTR